MNRLPIAKRVQILSLLCEGASMRSVARLVDVSINTVARELVLAGQACAAFHDRTVRNVKSKRVQCDEIWSFVSMKEKQAKRKTRRPADVGDVWTWTGLDADNKLIVSWFVGGRDGGAAYEFMSDLQSRLANRVQMTTDGHKAYLDAVDSTFGIGIDYAMLVKLYGEDPSAEKRYSPAECIGCESHVVSGHPDPDHISTSYVERQNLTMRMHMRRFTRLTNAFSKKLENHCHMIALYAVWYNFVKMHKTLRMTPAMAAGVCDQLWTVEKIVELVNEQEAKLPRQKVGRKLGQTAKKSN
ncbi:MAG: IS1 family transposase [Candidatus Binatia bacterium]